MAWYLPDTFQGAARQWQTRLLRAEARFVVPSLHYWEFGNVLRTYVRRGELASAIAREINETHLDAPLDVLEPRRADVFDLALEFDATVYDAVYIALARSLRSPLVTAERRTRPWVARLGRLAEVVR